MKYLKFYTFFLFIIFATKISSQDNLLNKPLEDDNSKFTNIGNIGLTVTNFGMYGHGFSLWPQQPSCEYPLGSGIEHIFDGGIWVGGIVNSQISVTTASVDASSVSTRGGGFEFTNKIESRVIERSSLLDSRFFNPVAISHQDFVMEYSDTSRFLENGELIVDHRPLGIVIKEQNYAWNFPFADFFIIKNFWISNVTNQKIDSVYVGLWTDTVVRNTNITSPRTGTSFFNKGGNGYHDSLRIAYEFDAAGDIGFTDSYIGIQFLGSSKNNFDVNFTSWQFRNTTDPNFFAPQNDAERYRKLQGFFGGNNKYNDGVNPNVLKSASNRSMLISAGPFGSIEPGDSINVVFAIVAAKKFGSDLPSFDTELQKSILYSNAGWALRAYNGEDRNGNGILDPNEDLDGNGKITRYVLPAPPSSPNVKIIPSSNKVTVYWDKSSEASIDPISGNKDFEGYRIYRTNTGFDLTEAQDLTKSLIKIAEFDSMGNDIGYNTGFEFIELDAPVKFENDDHEYFYKFEIDNLLNGWQYTFSITAFDEGDKSNGLESLESSIVSRSTRVLPGTTPVEEAQIDVGVYPNPYYGNAYWDGGSERLRKIYFFNLPSECEITIYTLSGDVVKRIYHDQSDNGSDLRWFETFAKDGKQIMSGGEHAWDLISDNDQAIATGLYLFTVKNSNNSNIKRGKFLIIK